MTTFQFPLLPEGEAYRTRWRMVPHLVTYVINYVILANTIPCLVKNVICLVSLANIMAIMYFVL